MFPFLRHIKKITIQHSKKVKLVRFMVLKTDHKGPLSLYCSSEPHPRHGVICRTKGNREEKGESERLG